MAESTEHRFLNDSFTSVLSDLAAAQLYTYREAERARLDFACVLAENWRHQRTQPGHDRLPQPRLGWTAPSLIVGWDRQHVVSGFSA